MKLNITNEKLTRQLLAANSVLANCKGSVKAVRLFMNMLGLKCIVVMPHSTVLANVNYTNTSIPTELHFTTNSTKLLDVDWFHAGNYPYAGDWPASSSWPSDHGDWWPTDPDNTPITNGNGCIYAETYDNFDNFDKLVEGNGHFPGKKFTNGYDKHKPTSIELYTYSPNGVLVHFVFYCGWDYKKNDDDKYEYTFYITNQPACSSTVPAVYSTAQAIKDYDELYKSVVENAFADMLTRLTNVQNLVVTSKVQQNMILGIPFTNNTDYMQMYITNATDKNLLPVKSIIAKQLQEILPINMIVEADNIIGCANE